MIHEGRADNPGLWEATDLLFPAEYALNGLRAGNIGQVTGNDMGVD